jgi:hypothetical protein
MRAIKLYDVLIVLLLLTGTNLFGQNISINDDGSKANTVALLDVNTTTKNKGLLFPRVTTAQMNAMTGTASNALLVFNTTENCFYYNASSSTTANWIPLLSSAPGSSTGVGGWALSGNGSTTTGNNFLGTTDAVDLLFKSGGSAAGNQRLRLFSGGNVVVGTATSAAGQLIIDGASDDNIGFENTGYILAKNASGSYQTTFYPRWSDNVLYTDYGAGGLYIRDNSSNIAIQADNSGNVGINGAASEKLEVTGNVLASDGTNYPVMYWGTNGSRTETRDNAGLRGDAGARSGFFETSAPSPATSWPAGATSYWHMLDVRHSNTGNNYALQIAGSFYDQELFFRKTNDNASQSWKKVLTWNRRGSVAFTTTSEFYSDEYIRLRWNGSSKKMEISAIYGQNGNWAVYGQSEEHSSSGSQTPHSKANTASAASGSWVVVGGGDTYAAEQPASGLVFYLTRVDSNAYPAYIIEILVHGSYVTFVVQRV